MYGCVCSSKMLELTSSSELDWGSYIFSIGKTASKKITHIWRRWGTPQNFFLGFIDELEKQIIIKKTVEVGQ